MARRQDIQKIDTLQSIELGDGVEISLRIAGPYVRAMALLIDYFIIIGVLIVLSIAFAVVAVGSNLNIAEGFLLIGLFLLSWGYFAFFESGKKGATLGKRAMGVRVVDRSGNRATRGQAFIRNLLRFIDMFPGVPSASAGIMIGGYGVGLTTCLLSKKFQRLGDLVANTVVIYSKPVEQLSSVAPPALKVEAPPLALTREEQAAITAYRDRSGLWSEARRIELADHASVLTKAKGHEGMARVLGMADWLTEGK